MVSKELRNVLLNNSERMKVCDFCFLLTAHKAKFDDDDDDRTFSRMRIWKKK